MHRSSIAAFTALVVCVCSSVAVHSARAQAANGTPRALTLEQAQAMAQQSNAGLGAMRKRVEETQRRSSIAFSNYLPRVRTQANYLASDNTRGILLPRGSLGYFAELGGVFPRSDRNVPQGGSDLFFAFTTVAQPITHYFKIREGLGVARADEDAGRASLRKAEQDVAFGVLQAYAGVLIAMQRRELARERVAARELHVSEQTTAVQAGTAPAVAAQEARVRLLQSRQELVAAEGELDDLSYTLADVIGLPPGTTLTLEAPPPVTARPLALEEYVSAALRRNPDVLSAEALVVKTTHGVRAARAEYIPDVGMLGAHFYQNSVPFFPRSTLAFGLQGSWTILDFGVRKNTVEERKAQLGQAERNLAMVNGRVRGEVEAAFRKLTRAQEIVDLAREGLALGTEAFRLRTAQSTAGYALAAQARDANVDRIEAQMNLMKAELGHRIALAELEKTAGMLVK